MSSSPSWRTSSRACQFERCSRAEQRVCVYLSATPPLCTLCTSAAILPWKGLPRGFSKSTAAREGKQRKSVQGWQRAMRSIENRRAAWHAPSTPAALLRSARSSPARRAQREPRRESRVDALVFAPTFSAAARSVRLFNVSRSAFSMVDAAATIWTTGAARRERRSTHSERTQTAQGAATHHPIRAALHVRIQVLVRKEELERKRLEARGGQGLAHRAAPPALAAARCFRRAHRATTERVG